MEEKAPSPLFPKSYGLLRMIAVSLSVLSLGFAIAFIGYFLAEKQPVPAALTPTPITTNTPTPITSIK